MNKQANCSGFTIVEMMTVVAIIGILSTVSVVGYGAWRNSAIEAQLKNDLTGIATAMTSARNFSSVYPTSVPATFKASQGIVLTGGGTLEGKAYCITATSGEINYRISANSVPELGMCPAVPEIIPVISLPVTGADFSVYSAGLWFSVRIDSVAVGTPTSTVQWQSRKYLPVTSSTWSGVVGGTSPVLQTTVNDVVNDIHFRDTLQYRVVYTNSAGSVTSPTVNVTFDDEIAPF